MSGFDYEKLIGEGKKALDNINKGNVKIPTEKELQEMVSKPTKDLAEEIGGQLAKEHGTATGKAAAGELWTKAKPFAIGALVLVGGILVVMAARKK